MFLTGLSLEIYKIHFVAQLRDCIARDPSDQSSHNWCRWKGLGLERVLKIFKFNPHLGLQSAPDPKVSFKIPKMDDIGALSIKKLFLLMGLTE
jgi:hypothetical protein